MTEPDRIMAAAQELQDALDNLPTVGVSNLVRPPADDADSAGEDQ